MHTHAYREKTNHYIVCLLLPKLVDSVNAMYVLKRFVLAIHITAKWQKTANDQTMDAVSLHLKYVQRTTV